MKKLISVFILFLMMPQLAVASGPMSLKEVIDSYTFEMTVVWDQKDLAFASEKEAELTAEINKLIANGLTQTDIFKATGVDIEPIVHEVSALDLTSSSEIASFLKAHKKFNQGASWTGVVIVIGVGLVVTLLAVVISQIVQQNKRYDACVAANNGNEVACIDNPEVLD